ncbi:hypothetical protein BBK36DRAFT_1170152 [Trichoderma citrinoviride]|uniref:Uncharacterized protein n=1 Tax=Trichoderma citrinoviride TaxID=58853 RepID=A0A2T4B7W1_9HYPO|nr:hypothetical protein BBK36DRAFT_1170152 [Trichoderma citrinoviride]PTB65416.1 hypothetical protein BBK36DRAFT_1170152 [Trichoderma citrinoviride]
MPPQTRSSSSSSSNHLPFPSNRANTTTTSNSTSTGTRYRHTPRPNNIPNPPYQQYPPSFSYTLGASAGPRPARRSSRSLANSERYEYTLIRTKKKTPHGPPQPNNTRLSTQPSRVPRHKHRRRRRHHHHHRHHGHRVHPEALLMPVVTAPVPNHQEQPLLLPLTPGLPTWRRPNLPPLRPATLPLSYFCRVAPYQPGQVPSVQSPYYFLVHLPEDQTTSSLILQQQQQQSPLTPNCLVSPYSLYRP